MRYVWTTHVACLYFVFFTGRLVVPRVRHEYLGTPRSLFRADEVCLSLTGVGEGDVQMPTGQDAAKAKLDNLIKCYGEEVAIDWLRCKFPSFETGSARKISIGESKGEKDYFASAKLLGVKVNNEKKT